MRYGSICSGVEAASLAWAPLGWTPAFLAEVEPFPCALLQQRWDATPPLRPLAVSEAVGDKDRLLRKKWAKEIALLPKTGSVRNLGDFTKIQPEDYDGRIDLLVGGTPCQSFSIAGLRGGLSDPRGNLMLEFTRLAYRTGARWVVWENVPGVLTSGDKGSDFAAFLSLLVGWEVKPPADGWRKCGIVTNAPGCFGVAWRVLDAQYTRVPEFPRAIPQRRRRVILVGHLDSWIRPAEVLFDGEMRGGDSPPRREQRQTTAGNSPAGAPPDCTLRVRCGRPGGGKGALVSEGVSQCLGTGNDQTLFQFDEPGLAYREGGYAGYKETEAAGPCRAAGGTLSAGSENIVVRPCWWNGKNVAPTLTTRSLGQRMPDEGQLPCVIDSREVDQNSSEASPSLMASDFKGGKLVVPPVCPTLDANYPTKQNFQDCDKLVVETEAYGAALDIHTGCPIAKEVSQTLKVSTAPGYNTAVAVIPKVFGVSPLNSNSMKSGNPDSGFPEMDVAKTIDATRPDPGNAQGGLAIVEPPAPPVAIPIDTINAADRPSNPNRKCGIGEDGDPASPITTFHRPAVCTDGDQDAGIVRRLLPLECERLMGFPDDYTRISWKGKPPEACPDAPRYKACGNSMCVNVMAWIGHRIQENEEKHSCPQPPSG